MWVMFSNLFVNEFLFDVQVGVLKCIVNITPHDLTASPATTSETAGTAGAVSGLIHGKKSHLTPIKLVEEEVKVCVCKPYILTCWLSRCSYCIRFRAFID